MDGPGAKIKGQFYCLQGREKLEKEEKIKLLG